MASTSLLKNLCVTLPRHYYFVRQLHFSLFDRKGHNKWSNIKATKEKRDSMRGNQLNILRGKVKTAIKAGGNIFDIKRNISLAAVRKEYLDKNLGLEHFDKAVDYLRDSQEEQVEVDLIGPDGVCFIIEAETRNKREFLQILNRYCKKTAGFRQVEDKSVRSRFETKGVLCVSIRKADSEEQFKMEEAEEIAIETNCEEINAIQDENNDNEIKFEFICAGEDQHNVEKEFRGRGLVIESSEREYRPYRSIILNAVMAKATQKFYEFLQEDEQIVKVFDNIDPNSMADG